MNIFILDENIEDAVQYTCDKHVVKMITESVQMLSSTMWHVGLEGPYKQTHINHPCTVWTRESMQNYMWHWDYADALGEEYSHRYNKRHKAHLTLHRDIPRVIDLPQREVIPMECTGLTPFAQALPDQYKNSDPVQAYRDYYIGDKAHFCTWKNRTIPKWFQEATQ